jgi:L-ascorbate metabolism protein UlaG (beta-lactamase superfamily)
MTPARHASGRHLFDGNRTLWAGYAFLGPEHRVFFSGDTGMFPGMKEIGARLGPFDVTMIEVGTYAQSWADWHMGPEQAVEAHSTLRGEVFLPIHWGLFNLSTHGWTEPIERVLVAAQAAGVTALAPRPGESFEPRLPFESQRWWPDLPWRTSEEYPVVSSLEAGGRQRIP